VSYVSVIEPHGDYNPTVEYTLNSHSQIKSVSHYESGPNEFVQIETKTGQIVGLGLAGENDAEKEHSVEVNGQVMTWRGPFKLFHSQAHKEKTP
jgi:tellurite resistance-related uncharacterized protein